MVVPRYKKSVPSDKATVPAEAPSKKMATAPVSDVDPPDQPVGIGATRSKRSGRNLHPGVVDFDSETEKLPIPVAKKARRTHAQVLADKAQKEKDKIEHAVLDKAVREEKVKRIGMLEDNAARQQEEESLNAETPRLVGMKKVARPVVQVPMVGESAWGGAPKRAGDGEDLFESEGRHQFCLGCYLKVDSLYYRLGCFLDSRESFKPVQSSDGSSDESDELRTGEANNIPRVDSMGKKKKKKLSKGSTRAEVNSTRAVPAKSGTPIMIDSQTSVSTLTSKRKLPLVVGNTLPYVVHSSHLRVLTQFFSAKRSADSHLPLASRRMQRQVEQPMSKIFGALVALVSCRLLLLRIQAPANTTILEVTMIWCR